MSTQLLSSHEPEVAHRQSRQDVRVLSAEPNIPTRLKEIWLYRPLLLSLVRKELKVKYKGSILGFAWSMLNPLFTLAIYYFVFQVILGNQMPLFAIYLLSGLLVWNLFSTALAAATGSITGNDNIVKKVSFPREVLPLASVGAALFNFVLQLIVMAVALVAFTHAPSPVFLLVAVLATAVLILFTSALAIFLSAINVTFRDTQHLQELVLMLWFWATPITYQFELVANKLTGHHWPQWLAVVNPITPVTLVFQNAFYRFRSYAPVDKKTHIAGQSVGVLPDHHVIWYVGHLGITALIGLLVMWGALVVFGRLEGNFAEEL
jgi:ABC-2 type transport system permease protein